MARKLDELKIFLASPGEVSEERAIVRDVVDEINRTVGREKSVVLVVVGWETDAYPSLGGDGQGRINDELGPMEDFDLFVGVLWNRFGMPTPRAESGTEEEFNRAYDALKACGRPDIMFYFCQRPSTLGLSELSQKTKVETFKQGVQKNGLTWDYFQSSDFRVLFHRHLLNWLARRTVVTPNPPAEALPQVPDAAQRALPPVNPTSSVRAMPLKTIVDDSGMWVLLGKGFFEAASVKEMAENNITIDIVPRSSEEDAALRELRPHPYRNAEPVPFAHQNAAGVATVTAANRESSEGRNVWRIDLRLEEKQANIMTEMAFGSFSVDQIAEMRARLILLNEFQPGGLHKDRFDSLMLKSVVSGIGTRATVEGSVLPELWKHFKEAPESFLPLARLWSVFHLISSNTVASVLDLKLGPLEGDKLHVVFRGRRHKPYDNVEAKVIALEGDCDLSTVAVSPD